MVFRKVYQRVKTPAILFWEKVMLYSMIIAGVSFFTYMTIYKEVWLIILTAFCMFLSAYLCDFLPKATYKIVLDELKTKLLEIKDAEGKEREKLIKEYNEKAEYYYLDNLRYISNWETCMGNIERMYIWEIKYRYWLN